MQGAEALSVEQMRQFLGASSDISLVAQSREETYAWVEGTLRAQQYKAQPKRVRGLILQYVAKMTGLSPAQVDRLVRRFKADGEVAVTRYRRQRFTVRFTRADVELLATVDEAHETLSGPATKRIMGREFNEFGRKQYERLATISVAHLYNLRKQRRYRECPYGQNTASFSDPEGYGDMGSMRCRGVHSPSESIVNVVHV